MIEHHLNEWTGILITIAIIGWSLLLSIYWLLLSWLPTSVLSLCCLHPHHLHITYHCHLHHRHHHSYRLASIKWKSKSGRKKTAERGVGGKNWPRSYFGRSLHSLGAINWGGRSLPDKGNIADGFRGRSRQKQRLQGHICHHHHHHHHCKLSHLPWAKSGLQVLTEFSANSCLSCRDQPAQHWALLFVHNLCHKCFATLEFSSWTQKFSFGNKWNALSRPDYNAIFFFFVQNIAICFWCRKEIFCAAWSWDRRALYPDKTSHCQLLQNPHFRNTIQIQYKHNTNTMQIHCPDNSSHCQFQTIHWGFADSLPPECEIDPKIGQKLNYPQKWHRHHQRHYL